MGKTGFDVLMRSALNVCACGFLKRQARSAIKILHLKKSLFF